MFNAIHLIGFSLTPGKFSYRGRRCQLRKDDIRQLRRLVGIVNLASRHNGDSPYWLLSYRDKLRSIAGQCSAAVLALLVDRTHSDDMRRLAIWLLGRRPGTLGIKAIAQASHHPDAVLRREVARALKRKHAWAELRDLLASDSDPRVRNLATQHDPSPHRKRLDRYLSDVTLRKTSDQRASLLLDIDLNTSPGRPPKTPQRIRGILEHIRKLIRGSSTRIEDRALDS